MSLFYEESYPPELWQDLPEPQGAEQEATDEPEAPTVAQEAPKAAEPTETASQQPGPPEDTSEGQAETDE